METLGIDFSRSIVAKGKKIAGLNLLLPKSAVGMVYQYLEGVLHVSEWHSYQNFENGVDDDQFKMIAYGIVREENFNLKDLDSLIDAIKSNCIKLGVLGISLKIQEGFLIKSNEYPLKRLNNPIRINSKLKETTFLSGDWFNRMLNDLVSLNSNRGNLLGRAIGNAGMYEGMKAAADVKEYYRFHSDLPIIRPTEDSLINFSKNSVLSQLVIDVLKSYGYCEIGSITDLEVGQNVLGYRIEVLSNVFRYNDSCDKREIVISRAFDPKFGFNKRNCFYFRDLIKGVFEALNEDRSGDDFLPENSTFIGCEYEIWEDDQNLFVNPGLQKIKGDLEGYLQKAKFGEKNRIRRQETCSYLVDKKTKKCIFYVFDKKLMIDNIV